MHRTRSIVTWFAVCLTIGLQYGCTIEDSHQVNEANAIIERNNADVYRSNTAVGIFYNITENVGRLLHEQEEGVATGSVLSVSCSSGGSIKGKVRAVEAYEESGRARRLEVVADLTRCQHDGDEYQSQMSGQFLWKIDFEDAEDGATEIAFDSTALGFEGHDKLNDMDIAKTTCATEGSIHSTTAKGEDWQFSGRRCDKDFYTSSDRVSASLR